MKSFTVQRHCIGGLENRCFPHCTLMLLHCAPPSCLCSVAYKFGVSGPFWYAAGATVQVLLFSILAVEVKRKAPHAHTVLEIINARWGKTAHLVYLFFTIVTNIIVTAMLVLGGAAVIEALSGVNIYAASMLIPIGVVAYTIQVGSAGMASCSSTGLGACSSCCVGADKTNTDKLSLMQLSPDLATFHLLDFLAGLPQVPAAPPLMRACNTYAPQGGLRATFLAAWSHTALIYIALVRCLVGLIGSLHTRSADTQAWQ